jgi:hypothetical protein
MRDRGVGAGDPLSLQSASSRNPKIGNITFTISHPYPWFCSGVENNAAPFVLKILRTTTVSSPTFMSTDLWR